MVFKAVLKYKILEHCLDVFWNNVFKNIISKASPIKVPEVGEYFSTIMSKDGVEFFYKCTIQEVYAEGDDYIIDFSYTDYDLKDVFEEDFDDDDIVDVDDDDDPFTEYDFDSIFLSEYILIK